MKCYYYKREGAEALKFCVIIEEKKTPMRLESNQVNKHSWLVFRQLPHPGIGIIIRYINMPGN